MPSSLHPLLRATRRASVAARPAAARPRVCERARAAAGRAWRSHRGRAAALDGKGRAFATNRCEAMLRTRFIVAASCRGRVRPPRRSWRRARPGFSPTALVPLARTRHHVAAVPSSAWPLADRHRHRLLRQERPQSSTPMDTCTCGRAPRARGREPSRSRSGCGGFSQCSTVPLVLPREKRPEVIQ